MEIFMGLRFIGKDPGSDNDHSPTVWLDEMTGDLILQGWKITDAKTQAEIGVVPENETVIRFPVRMIPFVLEAHDGDGSGPGVQ
ncbi:hypothetical protein [Streptosporangium sp. NPDC049046]|uniref:hypothetical protein n=1 Tax=Streptosporangium sp. NPDC049046 TaxID=3155031 RepID=UPI00342ABA41